MKKAMLYAAAFAATSAIGQVGTLSGGVVGAAGSGGAVSTYGAPGTFGSNAQMNAPDGRPGWGGEATTTTGGGGMGTASAPLPAPNASGANAGSDGRGGSAAPPLVGGDRWGASPPGGQRGEQR
jgi:hypothetical protein